MNRNVKRLFFDNRYFLIPYIFVLLFVAVLLVFFSKPELHIFSNELHTPALTVFFKYATFLGDGWMIAILFLALLIVRYRYALAFLCGSLLASLIVNLLKKVLLHDIYRPAKYFELFETYQLWFAEGVKVHQLQSFPSGHTTVAFSVFFMLAIVVKNNFLKILFLIVAILTGYSRIYLSQHFLVDVAAGSLTGILCILFSVWWFNKQRAPWLENALLFKWKKSNESD
ncbi:MAG: hypothetical protein CR996_01705 [Draconibacterium sp.]|nr:MAG: hypothetical protein CR996_01705 [Draconibacterium sp.]PIF06511.1 MAG: hypothetical protein CSA36_01315 [Draconibacterium sp.]